MEHHVDMTLKNIRKITEKNITKHSDGSNLHKTTTEWLLTESSGINRDTQQTIPGSISGPWSPLKIVPGNKVCPCRKFDFKNSSATFFQ